MLDVAITADFVDRCRNRFIARFLGYKEEHLDRHVPPEVAEDFRKMFLGELNQFADIVKFVVQAAADGAVVNEATITDAVAERRRAAQAERESSPCR